jgi:FHA domain
MAERRSVALRDHERDLAELRNRTERQLEALTTWQGFRAVSDALLDEAEARNALLASKVSSLTDSLRALGGSGVRTRPQSLSEGLKAEVESLQSQVVALRAELAVARQVAERSGSAPPGRSSRRRDRHEREAPDVPASATVVMYGEHWEYQEDPDDSPTGEVEQAPPQGAEASVRALVRQDGDGGVIYPLGRRTTIGRTADNDVQIDAPNVSRHHAVVLAGADGCRIEDLNSTNGVMVNGQRVVRQTLRDGDRVTIGKTELRFMQRS